MGSFIKVMKEDKGARALFVIFVLMILMGIACLIFALFRPQ